MHDISMTQNQIKFYLKKEIKKIHPRIQNAGKHFVFAKLSPSSSPSWAKLALVSLDPTTPLPPPTRESL
jgi:hypothetical protein